MQSFTADFILTPHGLKKGLGLALDQDQQISYMAPRALFPDAKHISGILSPPFVNAHCHLELSHLKGLIPKHTGMTGFVSALTSLRTTFAQETRREAMETALQSMWDSGIGAIGDICNTLDTLPVKQAHPEMWFHTFAEVFGRNPASAGTHLQHGLQTEQAFAPHAALSPHAPYSMSSELIAGIYSHSRTHSRPVTLHLLESEEERELFETGAGPMLEFLNQFYPYARTAATRPQDHALHNAPPNPFLLVHNTEMREDEMKELLSTPGLDPWFVLCPGANEYINHKLPPAGMFARLASHRICLGTDSLASNDVLDIMAEMKLLQSGTGLGTETLLTWGTYNGMKALGVPPLRGLVQIGPVEGESANFTEATRANRIA